jgi:DNA-binding transcriptional ArsR family regulator
MSRKTKRREAVENRLIAMSHPVRREVLRTLVERSSSPVEIGRELDLPTPNISHHVKRLVELGCAELVEERKVQGAIQHIYRATELTLVSKEEWDRMHPAEAQAFVAEIMQKILDDFLASEKAQIVGMDSDFHLSRTPISLDIAGLREAVTLMERVRLEVDDIVCRSVERSKAEGTETFPVSSSLGIFRMPGKHLLSD